MDITSCGIQKCFQKYSYTNNVFWLSVKLRKTLPLNGLLNDNSTGDYLVNLRTLLFELASCLAFFFFSFFFLVRFFFILDSIVLHSTLLGIDNRVMYFQ